MNKPWPVTIGNGMAGACTPEVLFNVGVDLFGATVVDAQPQPNFDNTRFSPMIGVGRLGLAAVARLDAHCNGHFATLHFPESAGSPTGVALMTGAMRSSTSVVDYAGSEYICDIVLDNALKTAGLNICPVRKRPWRYERSCGLRARLFARPGVSATHFGGKDWGTLAGPGETARVLGNRRRGVGSSHACRSQGLYLGGLPTWQRHPHVRPCGRWGLSMRVRCPRIGGPP